MLSSISGLIMLFLLVANSLAYTYRHSRLLVRRKHITLTDGGSSKADMI